MDAQYLHQLFLKHPTISTDSRAITKDSLFFSLSGEHFNGNQFAKEALEKGAAYAIIDQKEFVDSKQPEKYILVDNCLEALQELATFHRRYCNTPIIALTGSNGKTTTKELIYCVLKKKFKTIATKGNLNNHIGVPLSLLRLKKETEIAVIEMGANHQKEIELLCKIAQPNYGYITNFGLAHLEGFGSKEGVIKGKSELYDYLKSTNEIIFYNPKNPKQLELTEEYSNSIPCPKETVKQLENSEFIHLDYKNTPIKTNLIGNYNTSNIAVAIGIGEYFKIDLSDIKSAIESYKPNNNRSQKIEHHSNTIILDAYNANPSSMKAALDHFKQIKTDKEKILILGDMLELGNYTSKAHQELFKQAQQITKKLYVVGKEFSKVADEHFESTKDLKVYIKENPIKDAYILIKGSRGIALEQLLDIL